MHPRRRSLSTLVVVCNAWGTIPLVVRHVDLPAPAIVLARVWIASAGLALALAVSNHRRRHPGTAERRPRLFSVAPGRCLLAGALLAAHWTAMFAGYRRAPADTVIFVVFLAPVGVAALAPRLLGERTRPLTLVALAVAVAGLALIAGPSVDGAAAAGVGFAGLSALGFVALVLVSKPLAEDYGGLRASLIEMSVAGVALLPLAVRGTSWTSLPASTWLALAVLGLVHTALGISLYLAALAEVPAVAVGILGYLEPASVVLLSWLVLHEGPRWTTLVGGALVVAAGAAVVLAERDGDGRPTRPLPDPFPEVPAHAPG